MAEPILVTGKRISDMELVTVVVGTEKVPTGQAGDLAITPDQIAQHVITKGDFATQEDLSQVEINLQTQVANTNLELTNQTTQTRALIAAETQARILGDGNLQDSLDLVDQRVITLEHKTDAAQLDISGLKTSVTSLTGGLEAEALARESADTVLANGLMSKADLNLVQRGIANKVDSGIISGGGYSLGDIVLLDDGTEATSTIPNNINNPNFDMVGWKPTLSTENIMYKNGYTVESSLYYLTPEMFGAKGNYLLPDGTVNPNPHDDYQAIQSMLDAGAIGCTFEFDGAKTYYNAFGNFTPLSPWLDEDDRPQWTRRKRCTLKFNGARLTRRRPDWNTNNAVNDGNTGAYYTDDRTALLKLVGTGAVDDIWYMYDADFNSNVTLGWLYNHVTGEYDIGDGSYGAGTCMDWGLRLENIGVIKGTNCSFQRACFPVSGVNYGYISFDGLILKYAAQARYRTNDIDPGAFGGGIKLENGKNFYLNNVYGYKNANDTVELERYNGNGTVNGWSEFDINQSFMIYSSHDVTVDWTGKDIIRGSGFTIKASGAGSNSSNVRGKITLERVYGTGLDIIIDADYDRDLTGIDLDLQTTDCGYGGLQIVNNSPTHMPKGLKINHIDYNGNTWLNASRRFVGKMSGVITGANYAINGYTYPANFKGFIIEGTNTKETCLTMSIDLTPIPLVWQVAETAFVSLRNTVTSWGVFNLTADRQNISGGCSAGLHYPYNSSNIASSELALDGEKFKAVNLSSIASENGQIYVDLSSGASVGSGTSYNLKLFKTP